MTKKGKVDLNKIKAIDIASRKVAVIKPSADVNQALQKMKHYNFRRLPVLSNGQLVGVVTLKDILMVEPSLNSEIRELMQIREEEEKLKKIKISGLMEGLCENCGSFAELLKVDGKFLCPDCREELY